MCSFYGITDAQSEKHLVFYFLTPLLNESQYLINGRELHTPNATLMSPHYPNKGQVFGIP